MNMRFNVLFLKFISALILGSYYSTFNLGNDEPKLKLEIKSFKSSNKSFNRLQADSAMILVNSVFNSNEFKDSILKYNFSCSNYNSESDSTCKDGISGQMVWDTLFKSRHSELDLQLDNCFGNRFFKFRTIGVSFVGKPYIKSCYFSILQDDSDETIRIPFSYKYANNICQQYMGIIGFHHVQGRQKGVDVAETTGLIIYNILRNWYINKKQIDFSSLKKQ